MDKKSAMLDALRNKRMHGLDVTIILGGAKPVGSEESPMEEEKESKEMGLAPKGANPEKDAEQPMHSDEMQDKALIEEELAKAGLGKNSLASKAKQYPIKK